MIPKAIEKAAEGRKHLGGELRLIGTYRGKDVYTYVYQIPVTIGQPEVYLWNGKKAELVFGERAFSIISSFSPFLQ